MQNWKELQGDGPTRPLAVAVIAAALLHSGCGDRPSPDPSGRKVATTARDLTATAFIPAVKETSWNDRDDPGRDGWESEIWSERANGQLVRLSGLMEQRLSGADEDLAPLIADTVSCERLLPKRLNVVFEDQLLKVERATPDETGVESGALRFRTSLQELLSPLEGAAELRVVFKIYRIAGDEKQFTTRQHLAVTGRSPDAIIEQHADWEIRWESNPDQVPRIAWVGVKDFEQVAKKSGAEPVFSDCTESILGDNACYAGQLLLGFNHWLDRSQDLRFLYLLGNPGVALGDANGDELEDLFLCQEAGLPNRLFLQQPDGTLRDVSAEAGLDWLENSRCALLVDLDNDGDQDIAVGIDGGVAVAANDGHAGFRLRTILGSSADVISLSAADYDRDGRLDLYAGIYHRDSTPVRSTSAALPVASGMTVYHDANNGGRNSLFRNTIRSDSNLGDEWAFEEVTSQVGLDSNNSRFTLAASWEDFDNDGDQDLYVANDFGRNNLSREWVVL